MTKAKTEGGIRQALLQQYSVQRLDSIANFASGLGTDADLATHARPASEALNNRLTDAELDILYLQNDLARRIVDERVHDAVRQGWEARDKSSGSVIEEPAHLDIGAKVTEAGQSSRRTGAAGILMVTGDTNWDKELGTTPEIKSLQVFEKAELGIKAHYDREGDQISEHFLDPKLYTVSPYSGTAGKLMTAGVHHSRLLMFRGATLPRRLRHLNQDFDDSVLQAIWPPLQRFYSTEQAIANIIQRFEVATLSIKGLGDILSSVDGGEMILKRVKLINRTLSMINAAVIDADAGEEYSRAFSQVSGLDTLWDRLAHSVAKAANYPMTQLFGMSPSGLSSDDESGRANWRKFVTSYQDTEIRPVLERYYKLLNGGNDVIIEFNALDESTAKEEAEIDKLKAETRGMYVQMGTLDPEAIVPLLVKEGMVSDEEELLARLSEALEAEEAKLAEEAEREQALISSQPTGDVPEGAPQEDPDGETDPPDGKELA